MRRKLLLIICIVIVGCLAFGCAPKPIVEEQPTVCLARDLGVDVNTQTMDVHWKTDCASLISGFNIYISDTPLNDKYPGADLPAMVKPFNPAPYPGDTNPDDAVEHFIADGLQDGKKYYVSVRVVMPDGTVSKPSNEVVAVCGPSGEMELSIRYKSDHDGFAFSLNDYVRADDLNNDLYYFSKDGKDYLNSPVKLDGFLKANRLRRLPFRGDFNDVREMLNGITSESNEDRLEVSKGDWIHLQTPTGENAVIRVLGFSGEGSDRKIRLFYAFSPYSQEILF
ncbi:MAG: hypothetical protein AB1483_06475 [Candidatus Zixiibacteriota bacterium]